MRSFCDRVRFAAGDLFEPVRGEEFDLVVSNPPYLARAEAAGLPPELAHEPEAALFAGDDGFAVLAPLVDQVGEVLAPGGAFAVEAGSEQVEAVAERCRRVGLEAVEVRRDLARQPRVVVARRGES